MGAAAQLAKGVGADTAGWKRGLARGSRGSVTWVGTWFGPGLGSRMVGVLSIRGGVGKEGRKERQDRDIIGEQG